MDLPGLNFRPGKVVEAEVLRKFGTSVCVHPSSSSNGFLLVLSFGRCKFRLSEVSAALILQATIGGSAALFHVRLLSDRVFSFRVSNQVVGFHIYNLRAFECANYKVYFNLWHGGGPNFRLEYKNWLAEEIASWSSVRKKHSASSPSLVRPLLTGANTTPISHNFPIKTFASNLNHPFIPNNRPSVLIAFKYALYLVIKIKFQLMF
jgi:hypothetical protein